MEPALIKFGYDVVKDVYKALSKYTKVESGTIKFSIEAYLEHLDEWSRFTQAFGMSKNKLIDEDTIKIGISSHPRKLLNVSLDNSDAKLTELDEDSILDQELNSIVLGDPGSGKTTLVKRIVRNICFTPYPYAHDRYKLPIVIFGRDLDKSNSLFADLLNKIGLSESIFIGIDGAAPSALARTLQISRALTDLGDKDRLLLIIDGYDEISIDYRHDFYADLSKLRRAIPQVKIIITSRPGDWNRQVDGFDVFQILPLRPHQIDEIVETWATNPTAFMHSVETSTFWNVLDRPLILTMMIAIFNADGQIPDRSIDIYERMVALFMERWDKSRGIKRTSSFARFSYEKKLRFLRALAFNITFIVTKTRFSRRDIEQASGYLRRELQINPTEIPVLLRELEAHTGLIVEFTSEEFEFSHLTLQEFLAAEYIVSTLATADLAHILDTSPPTMAVAVALSPESENTLAAALDSCASLIRHGASKNIRSRCVSFFTRLRLEKAVYEPSVHLALSFMSLFDALSRDQMHKNSDVVRDILLSSSFLLEENFSLQSFRFLNGFYIPTSTSATTTLHLSRSVRFKTFVSNVQSFTISAQIMHFLHSRGIYHQFMPSNALIGDFS